jgi:nucleotide-binding universal stress UspA family protein
MQMDEAERIAGMATLDETRLEGEKTGYMVKIDIRKGHPERIIAQQARDLGCGLVAILASEGSNGRPSIGPESIGHTARFVLDHAPCDVLLLR